MKHQFIAVIVTVASTGMAFAWGNCCPNLEPVREKTIKHRTCPAPQRIVSRSTVYVPIDSSCHWVQPDRSAPTYVIGSVLTAPFRLITGRSLGQPDVVGERIYSQPMGERVTTMTTTTKCSYDRCGDMKGKTTTSKSRTMLMPVGEKLTTIKYIRTKPMPVAERGMTCPTLSPVAEKTMTCPALKPVCERTMKCPLLKPVGERGMSCPSRIDPVGEKTTAVTTCKRLMPAGERFSDRLEPIGERVLIKKTPIRQAEPLKLNDCGCH